MVWIPRWARRRFPELDSFPSEEERKRAWKRATRSIMRRWQYWVALLVGTPLIVVVGVLCLPIVVPIIRAKIPGVMDFLPSIIGGVVGGFCGSGVIIFFRWQIARSLREQLVELGVPVCIACGYDLRGQTEPRCPECGRPFDAALLKSHREEVVNDPSE